MKITGIQITMLLRPSRTILRMPVIPSSIAMSEHKNFYNFRYYDHLTVPCAFSVLLVNFHGSYLELDVTLKVKLIYKQNLAY